MTEGYKLSLDGPAFNSVKTDFNRLLTRTIREMQDKSVEDASIMAKIDIHLSTEGNPNVNAPDSEAEREYTAPRFKHKVTASMQIKNETSGETGGKKFELQWDGKAGSFMMLPVKTDPNQMEIWDKAEQPVRDSAADSGEDEEPGEDGAEPGEASQELAEKAIQAATAIVREAGIASVALLQRRMQIGYRLAAALLDKLEELGVVGPFNGTSPRQVLPYVLSAEDSADCDATEPMEDPEAQE